MKRKLWLMGLGVTLGLLTTLAVVSFVSAQGPNQSEYTNFQIQNLSDETAAVVIEVYNTSGGLVASKSITIPGGSSTSFSQNPGVVDPLGIPGGFIGSVRISSDKEVAAIANQFVSDDPFNPRIAAAYNGVAEPSNQIFMPLHWRRFAGGWDTRFFCQNTSESQATVSITYTHDSFSSSTTDHVESGVTIPARGLLVRKLYDDLAVLGSGWEGSVKVSSNQPLACVADGFWEGAIDFEMNYNAFGPNDADTKIYAPALFRQYAMPWGWNTNIFVANFGTVPADVKVTFIGGGLSTPVVTTQTIAVSGRFQQANFTALPTNWTGSAVVESTNGQPIVAVVLEATSSGTFDRSTAYSAVPDSQAATKVSVPMAMKTFYCAVTWNTNVPVMNTEYETGPAEVYITYSGGGLSSPVQRHFTITDTQMISQFGETSLPGGLPCTTGWRGSAVVTSTRPIVAVVNENALAVSGDLAETYNGIGY